MPRPGLDGATRRMRLLRDTQSVRRGENEKSSPDPTTSLLQDVIAGDRLDSAGANLVAPAHGLGHPEALNLVGCFKIEALNELVSEHRPGCDGKLHRFFSPFI